MPKCDVSSSDLLRRAAFQKLLMAFSNVIERCDFPKDSAVLKLLRMVNLVPVVNLPSQSRNAPVTVRTDFLG